MAGTRFTEWSSGFGFSSLFRRPCLMKVKLCEEPEQVWSLSGDQTMLR